MRKTLIVEEAQALSNGIMFDSSSNPDYTTLVTIDENQNVKTKWLSKKVVGKYEKEVDEKNIKKITYIVFMFFTLPMFLICALFDRTTAVKVQKEIFSINPKSLLIALLLLIIGIILCALMTVYFDSNLRRFHAAEHMIINAYSKLHRVPSIEELSQYSRFNTSCGSNCMVIIFILCMVSLLYLIFKVNFNLCYIILLVSIVFEEIGLLNFVQLLVTKPPTERELRVAIIGMNAWLENEQKSAENNFSDFS